MLLKRIYKPLAAILVLALTMTGCGLLPGTGGVSTPDQAQISTLVAGTVAAQATQAVLETMIADLTQIALPTNTSQPTFTPTATFTPVPPTATPVPPTVTPTPIPCNAASFIKDVTIADWSSIYAGESFVKTWQIKNVGSCSWTKDYKIFFFGGNQMGAGAVIAFPKVVNPGETVNLSVSMVAPSDPGNYSGSWMLKAANGAVFGVGNTYNVPLTVNIKVAKIPAAKDPNTVYDFVKNMCKASWRTNAGKISCPSAGIDTKNGSITRSYAPVLDDGFVDDEGALYTVPAVGGDGMIEGKFPKITINAGDHFVAALSCRGNSPKCSVTYELLYIETSSGTTTSLGTWDREAGDGLLQVDIDLSALAGQEVAFKLKVMSNHDSTDDIALWLAARLTNP